MTRRYVLALDQGTTSSRAILFDRQGRPVASQSQEFRQIFPQPGWVEHDPLEIWESQLGTARAVLAQAGARADDVAAIGITNQRETAVVWDRRTGQPVANAIVWQDRRTAEICEDLRRRGLAEMFRERTGLVLDPYFSGTKIAWLLEHVPGLRGRAERGEVLFGTVDTWLVWNLSGGRAHLTDYSNASRTLLFDIRRLDWDDALLGELGVPRAMLPEVRPSSGVVGTVPRALLEGRAGPAPLAQESGRDAVPIAGMAGDQQAALFGQCCFRPGMAKNTYGTGCFMLMHTGARPVSSRHGLLSTIAWGLGGRVEYALEGSVFIAGAAVQWLRDGLGIISRAAETEALARSVADTGGMYLVPAFAGLGAPHWDPYARGAIVGLTRGTGRAELARAALEAIAYQSRDVLDAMQADAGIGLQALRVDGGAVANDFLMQFQADMLGVPVDRPVVNETTALGAAYLAGLAVGFWRDRGEIEALWQRNRRFEPALEEARRKTLYAGWRRAVERARGWEAPADRSIQAGSAHGPGGEGA